MDDLETATRQMSIERREEAIVRPSIESGDKVPALNSNRACEEEDDESDIRPPRRNLRRSDHSIRRHAKRSISEVEERSESEDGDIDETLRKGNRTANKHRPWPLRPRKHTPNDSDDEIMVDTSVVQGEEEEEEEAEQEADRRNDRTIIVPMDDVNVADSHGSQEGKTDDTLLCSSAEEGDNWPEEDYSPDNVNGRLPDPDGDTGSDICSEYDDDKVETRSGFIEQENLDFNDLEDGAEAVERVARTTIAEQMGDGVAESVAAFFDEDVEKIKLRTHKVWIPGMKKKDEKGDPVGLLSFQLFGVRFLIGNIKSIACGGFLCDDMGLGKTLRTLTGRERTKTAMSIKGKVRPVHAPPRNPSNGDSGSAATVGRALRLISMFARDPCLTMYLHSLSGTGTGTGNAFSTQRIHCASNIRWHTVLRGSRTDTIPDYMVLVIQLPALRLSDPTNFL